MMGVLLGLLLFAIRFAALFLLVSGAIALWREFKAWCIGVVPIDVVEVRNVR